MIGGGPHRFGGKEVNILCPEATSHAPKALQGGDEIVFFCLGNKAMAGNRLTESNPLATIVQPSQSGSIRLGYQKVNRIAADIRSRKHPTHIWH